MDNISFISVVRDFEMYNRVIKNNPYVISDQIILSLLDNTKKNIGLSKRYNKFLNIYDYKEPCWFVFCHEDWEILESILPKVENLNKNELYGCFGARLSNIDGVLTREYIGEMLDCSKKDKNHRKLGSSFEDFATVDVLDCQALIVHSTLIKKFDLRFDEEFEWDLYVEDFCLNAYTKHGIKSKVIKINACHWSQINNLTERPSCVDKYPYINRKYNHYTFAGMTLNIGKDTEKIKTIDLAIQPLVEWDRSKIYQNQVVKNDARFIAIEYIKTDKRILDVGCACGDFAIALKREKNAKIWGMEYNPGSIAIAMGTKMFEEIYEVDLNDFIPEKYKEFFGFFDYIVLGDVLEHLYHPQKVLEQLSILLKQNGSFILSIPNIAHASIKSNLLLNDFTYTPYGLLDETHVRFFTQKSIAPFLADIGLVVVNNKFTYQDKIGCQPTNPYSDLPTAIKKQIFEDLQSYVLQFVMEVKKSGINRIKNIESNTKKLSINEENAPQELLKMRAEDLNGLELEVNDKVEEKEREILWMKSSKFWKLYELYHKVKTVGDSLRNPQKDNSMIQTKARSSENDFVNNILENNFVPSKDYVEIAKQEYIGDLSLKLIAFYLPQFHPIDVNDRYYGKGFTEWTNVAKAIPQFTGHYQPQIPIDVGFYDLRNIDTMRRQVELAKMYGIYGFCFHYYWFSGKRLLEKPILNWLKNKDIDFPFCLCWANENWAKMWDGGNFEPLVKQELKTDDDKLFMKDILPFFKDGRYIKIDNKPVLVIYRPHLFEKKRAKRLFESFKKIAQENGFPGLYLITANSHGFRDNPRDWGLDAVVEFPPHGLAGLVPTKEEKGFVNPNFKGTVYDMKPYVEEERYNYDTEYPLFKTVFPSWDNTARKAYTGAHVFGMDPDLYKKWLTGVIKITKKRNPASKQFIFINSWNEWAEGAHLEPDDKYGYAYLQSTREALEKISVDGKTK